MGAACWFAQFCCSEEIQEAEESEWIGYNTMIRFKEASEAAKGIEESPTGGPEAVASPGGPGWSMAGQRDPDSEEELAASDDSWGSVVDTGVEALQQLMQGK